MLRKPGKYNWDCRLIPHALTVPVDITAFQALLQFQLVELQDLHGD